MKARQFVSILLLGLFFSVYSASAQVENAILGTWYNTEKTAKVDIIKNGSEFLGKISWLQTPTVDGKPATDKQNSDPKLRTRPLMGMTILNGLKYSGEYWKSGQIYDPNTGKTYSCELKLKSPEILEVKGYLGFSFVGRTVEWTKAK
jgi:uncharacterized protein (DUF2147 family)